MASNSPRALTSHMWDYFVIDSTDNDKAFSKINGCGKPISRGKKNHNITNLVHHLEHEHRDQSKKLTLWRGGRTPFSSTHMSLTSPVVIWLIQQQVFRVNSCSAVFVTL